MQKAKNKQGIMVVIAAMSIQFTLGIAYLWTLFQTGVTHELFGGDDYNHLAALTFSILLFLLTIGSVFGGKLAIKLSSTRIVVFVGGIILSLGFLLSSFVTSNAPWLLWITYGLMGGMGMGFTYSTTIACAQKWYPHKKGLISGIIVSALGFGGVVFMPIIMLILGAFGEPNMAVYGNPIMGGEQTTFWILSIVFFVICSIGSLFLKHPPKIEESMSDQTTIETNDAAAPPLNEAVLADKASEIAIASKPSDNSYCQTPADYSATQMLKSIKFYLIMFTFLMAVIGGQMMIAFIRPIEILTEFDNTMMIGGLALSIGVLVLSACNSGGRLLWGIICDKIGRINTIIILLTASGALFLLVGLAMGTWVIFVMAALIGLMYGGILSVFPTLTAETFGSKNMATNYGFVLLGFGIGAIASSQIGGIFANRARYYGNANYMFYAFIIGAACAAVGIGLMVILKFIAKKKNAPPSVQEESELTDNATHSS